MLFVPFAPQHLDMINVQPRQRVELDMLPPADVTAMAKGREAWTAFDGFDCLGAAGIIDVPGWPNRGYAWAIIGQDIGHRMVPCVRFIRGVLDRCPRRRIEMTVQCDWPEGDRFARLLGFDVEAPRMVGYSQDGSDMALYARLRY